MPTGIQPSFITFLIVLLYVGVPIIVVYLIYRIIRGGWNSSVARQEETQRLLKEAIELLRENNRLLGDSQASNPPKQ